MAQPFGEASEERQSAVRYCPSRVRIPAIRLTLREAKHSYALPQLSYRVLFDQPCVGVSATSVDAPGHHPQSSSTPRRRAASPGPPPRARHQQPDFNVRVGATPPPPGSRPSPPAAVPALLSPHAASQPAMRAGHENGVNSLMRLVPKAGVEPACRCRRRILSPLRLPFRHFGPWSEARAEIVGAPSAGCQPRACRCRALGGDVDGGPLETAAGILAGCGTW